MGVGRDQYQIWYRYQFFGKKAFFDWQKKVSKMHSLLDAMVEKLESIDKFFFAKNLKF